MLIVLKRILGALPLTILNHISSLTEVPHSKIKTILLEKQNLLGIAFLRKIKNNRSDSLYIVILRMIKNRQELKCPVLN